MTPNKPKEPTAMDMNVDDYVQKVLKDFEELFMAEGGKKELGSDYKNFLGSIPFLTGWPILKLAEHSCSFMINYFNPGEVIVKDSNHSDWIYIVKAGSVSVMKCLTGVSARKRPAHRGQHAKRGLRVTVPFKQRRGRRSPLAPLKPLEVPRPKFDSQFELQMKLDQTIPGVYKESDRLGILDYDTIFQEYKDRLRLPRMPEVTSQKTQETEPTVAEVPEAVNASLDFGGPAVLPEIRKNRGVYMSAQGTKRAQSPVIAAIPTLEDTGEPGSEETADTTGSSVPLNQPAQPLPAIITSSPKKSVPSLGIVTTSVEPTAVKPLFILLQVLEKGQYFGVADVVLREGQPSLSLVSNGAECLLLSKSFFRQHSTEGILNELRKTEVPYPSDSELQDKLQRDADWRAYRRDAYRQVIIPLTKLKARRRQYTNNYRGQYNFRTGPL